MPTWWDERRFGLFVHSNLATVPAWSPIGEYSDWYRSHLAEDVADVMLHPRPMVEVLAHHRDRWGHIERYDDFLPLLTYEDFDAEAWARLAVDAGAGYTIFVAKHHDGWSWWDAPNTDRTVLSGGPCRNVLAEYAAACERNDVVFGTYYSLLDWGDGRYPTDAYVEEILHPHVIDLVERFGSGVLWGDGHWGNGPDRWRTRELLERVWSINPDVVVNDRWWAAADAVPSTSPDIVRTYEYEAPDDIVEGPWELCRGIGASFCHNRAERAEHHMSGFDIVALLTEVVAKGGHLLLNVGPAADGTIPQLQTGPLRAAGAWIHRHDRLVNRGRPWSVWGDEHVRYLDVDGALHAVDLDGKGRFARAGVRRPPRRVGRVAGIDRRARRRNHGEPIRFHQDETGLHTRPAPLAVGSSRRPPVRGQRVPDRVPGGRAADRTLRPGGSGSDRAGPVDAVGELRRHRAARRRHLHRTGGRAGGCRPAGPRRRPDHRGRWRLHRGDPRGRSPARTPHGPKRSASNRLVPERHGRASRDRVDGARVPRRRSRRRARQRRSGSGDSSRRSRRRRRPAVGGLAMSVHRHAMGRRDPPDRRRRTPRQFL